MATANRNRTDSVRSSRFAHDHANNARFVAGVILFLAEGSKTCNDLILANTDGRALRLFIGWTRESLDPAAEFLLSLHLHAGNDEATAMAYWREMTTLVDARSTKTFVEPTGTSHRKNSLAHAVCRVRVMKASDHRNRVMAWIDVVAHQLIPNVVTLAPGR